MTIEELKKPLIAFLEERDWLSFNNRDSLAKTLFIESAELLVAYDEDDDRDVLEECGDVLSALLQIDILRGEEIGISITDRDLQSLLDIHTDRSEMGLAREIASLSSKLLINETSIEEYYRILLETLDAFFALLDLKGLDPYKVLVDKLALTARHYPVEKCKGKATKYTDL